MTAGWGPWEAVAVEPGAAPPFPRATGGKAVQILPASGKDERVLGGGVEAREGH